MPVERTLISVSQLADLVGVEPAQFIAVEKRLSQWYVVTEGPDMQTSGTFPELTKGGKKIGGGKKGPRKGC